MIREAKSFDASEIAAIWNHYVETSTATLNRIPHSGKKIEQLLEEISDQNWGAFVAEDGNTIQGFALYKQFRNGIGYAFSMEHSIYIRKECHTKGLGSKLYLVLEAHARERSIHSLTAAITTDNLSSISFHQKHGFSDGFVLPEIGYKFDRWHDVVFMQKILK